MFLINDEQISTTQKTQTEKLKDPFAIKIQKGIEEIKEKYKFPVIIKYPPALENVRSKDRKAGFGIPLTTTISNEDGFQETWTYYESTRRVKEPNGNFFNEYVLVDGKRKLDFRGRLVIDKNRAELAYYLIYICEQKDKKYVVENREQDAMEIAGKRKEEALLLKYCYDDLKDEALLTVAKAYGISNVEGMSTEMVQNALYERAKSIGYAEFRKNRTANEYNKLKAMVQTAIDKGVIGKDPTKADVVWYFMLNGKTDTKILAMKKGVDHLDTLHQHFSMNENHRTMLETALA